MFNLAASSWQVAGINSSRQMAGFYRGKRGFEYLDETLGIWDTQLVR